MSPGTMLRNLVTRTRRLVSRSRINARGSASLTDQPPSPTRLPDELILLIAEHLPARRDTVALMLCCHVFYDLLAPIAYRTISCTRSYGAAMRVLLYMAQKPRFAAYVQHLYLDVVGALVTYPKAKRPISHSVRTASVHFRIATRLRSALPNLKNLHTLVVADLTIYFANIYKEPTEIIQRIPRVCILPRNISLYWFVERHGGWTDADPPLGNESKSKRTKRDQPSGQRETKTLAHSCLHPTDNLDRMLKHTKPCFDTFIATHGAIIRTLVVHVFFLIPDTAPFFSNGPVCVNLQKLEIQTHLNGIFLGLDLVRSGAFPNLASLSLKNLMMDAYWPDWTTPEGIPSLLQGLQNVAPRLRVFVDPARTVWTLQSEVWARDPGFIIGKEWYEPPTL